MILVTGATGHFGNAAINHLLEKGVKANEIAALVRNDQAADEFKKKGVVTKVADYDNYDSLVDAFKGVEKLLFVSGSDIVKRLEQHKNVINAASDAGVKHVVYTSFQRKNETEDSPLWMVAQSHIQTEKLDFLPGFIGEKVLETGVIYVPAEHGKVGAVLRAEMAEAAANILATSGHEGKEYDFTNSEAVTYQELAEIISKVSGKEIKYISPSPDEYNKTLANYGVPNEVIGIFSSFAIAQAQGELDKESTDLEKLLGRKPLAVNDFLSSIYSSK
jgi:NAD(P)H dehydrogenase (quinone)